MCWKTNNLNYSKKHTVTENNGMKVIKFCHYDNDDNKIKPFYYRNRGIEYKVGVAQRSPLIIRETSCFFGRYWSVDYGIHSFDAKLVSINFSNGNPNDVVSVHRDNLYTLPYLDSYGVSQHTVALICTIPYGATYFENEYGEVVSDMIIPSEVIGI